HVQVRVLAVDPVKNQISLSMKLEASPLAEARPRQREDANLRSRRAQDSVAKPAGPFPKASKHSTSKGAGRRDSGLRSSADTRGRPHSEKAANSNSSKAFTREAPRSLPASQGRPSARPPAKPFNNPFAALQGLGGTPNSNKKN
ncbi:MAG: hypothetical protein WCH11_06945, partial [Bdellovibrio sp.]